MAGLEPSLEKEFYGMFQKSSRYEIFTSGILNLFKLNMKSWNDDSWPKSLENLLENALQWEYACKTCGEKGM